MLNITTVSSKLFILCMFLQKRYTICFFSVYAELSYFWYTRKQFFAKATFNCVCRHFFRSNPPLLLKHLLKKVAKDLLPNPRQINQIKLRIRLPVIVVFVLPQWWRHVLNHLNQLAGVNTTFKPEPTGSSNETSCTFIKSNS